jgi:hypothetical protein
MQVHPYAKYFVSSHLPNLQLASIAVSLLFAAVIHEIAVSPVFAADSKIGVGGGGASIV